MLDDAVIPVMPVMLVKAASVEVARSDMSDFCGKKREAESQRLLECLREVCTC